MLLGAIALASHAEPLEDVCECECCYKTSAGKTECVSKSATSFESQSCLACNKSTCAQLFKKECGKPGTNIEVGCFERTAWYLRLIPVIFVVSTAALLFYGLFIKTYDGYNPIPLPSDPESPSTAAFTGRSMSQYHAIAQSNFDPHLPHAVRRPSPLSQTAPLVGEFLASSSGELPHSTRRSPIGTLLPPRMSPLAAPSITPLTATSAATPVRVTEPLSPPLSETGASSDGVQVLEIKKSSGSKDSSASKGSGGVKQT